MMLPRPITIAAVRLSNLYPHYDRTMASLRPLVCWVLLNTHRSRDPYANSLVQLLGRAHNNFLAHFASQPDILAPLDDPNNNAPWLRTTQTSWQSALW